MNPYLAIYEMTMFLNHNCSSTIKQVYTKSGSAK